MNLSKKIRAVFEEGWHCGVSGVESLERSWGYSEARAFANVLVPLPAEIFAGGNCAHSGDLVILVSNGRDLQRQDLYRIVEQLTEFGDQHGIHFVLVHGAHTAMVVSSIHDRLRAIANQSRDPGEMVDRMVALLTGQRFDDPAKQTGG